MITHLEPDILECEVKWASGIITTNKASGGDGIPSALNMPANLENSAVDTGLEKVSFHSNLEEKQCQRMLKLPHIALISHASKAMLKILQARLQHYKNYKLPDV